MMWTTCIIAEVAMVIVFNGGSKASHKFTTICYFVLFTVENKMFCLLPLRVWSLMCSLGTQHVATSASTSNISAANLRPINLGVAVKNKNMSFQQISYNECTEAIPQHIVRYLRFPELRRSTLWPPGL